MIQYQIHPNKLGVSDSPIDICTKLSEGNPGAMQFVMSILKKSEEDIDYIKYLLVFDSLKLYGSRLYMLWNDCCCRSLSKVCQVIDNLVEGDITEQQIIDHINFAGGRGIPFDTPVQLSQSQVRECRHLFMEGKCQKCGIPQESVKDYAN